MEYLHGLGAGAVASAGGFAAAATAIGGVIVSGAAVVGGGIAFCVGVENTVENLKGDYELPYIMYTPYAIFSNSIPIFDINFFSPQNTEDRSVLIEVEGEEVVSNITSESSASILQESISKWYYALRNTAIVVLLSILVYVAIRMIISTVSKDKAKYRQMLIDWVVGMCLVICMHYIMIFIVNITQDINNFFVSMCVENILVPLPPDTTVDIENEDGEIETITLEDNEEAGVPIWSTNLMGYAQLIANGYANGDDEVSRSVVITKVSYTIIYVVMVIYTLVFTVMYLKRVLYMAFLTVIAPLVAMTYPLDKLHDGQAQGFNIWLKEYIFNALLQPLHLLLYAILIGSVMELASKYPVYALVAMGFMIPAEKMIKSMFGFEKASTPAAMGAVGAATAGMLMSGINRVMHRPKKNHGSSEDSDEKENKIRMRGNKFDTLGTYASENSNSGEDMSLLQSEDNNQTDYERANAFRNYRQQGLSQEEALARLNQENNAEDLEQNNSNNNTNPMLNIGRQENNNQEGSNPVRGNYQNNVGLPIYRQLSRDNVQSVSPKRTIRNRLGNGMMAVGARYQNKLRKSHPLRTLRRGVTYGMGAAALGIIGLSAGIASGDLGKTGQYALAAGAVGGGLAKGIGDKVASESNRNKEAFKQGWYGEEYEDKIREKKIRELQTDPNNVQYLRARDENYREILRDAYPDYARNGCYNIEDFYAAYQLEKAGASRNSAIAAYKLAKRTGDITSSPDAENKWQQRLSVEFANTQDVNRICEAEYRKIEEQYKEEEARVEAEYERQYRQMMYDSDKSDEYRKIEEQQKMQEAQLSKEYEKQYNKVLKDAELERETKLKQLEKEYKSRIDSITDSYQKKTIAKEYEQKKKNITAENTKARKKKHQELEEKFKSNINKLQDKYKEEFENIELEPIDKEKLTILKEQKNNKFKELREKREEQEEKVKEIPIRFSEAALEDVKKFYDNKE